MKTSLIQEALGNILQKEVIITSTKPVPGGDINQAFKLETSSGLFFLKQNSNRYKGMFQKEFNGLLTLSETSAIKVPGPFATGDDSTDQWLVMEWLKTGPPATNFWETFGKQLALLHRNTSTDFGFYESNYIGSVQQLNDKCATWKEFYATQRILPMMMTALQLNKCNKNDLEEAILVCKKVDSIFSEEPPALLHGDLWSGNFLIDENGNAAIYDPAVYYGHREMDLGMTLLFGGFDSAFYLHYHETYPLEKNWRERVGLCQLYPLLVHLILFGGHYYNQVKDILKKFC